MAMFKKRVPVDYDYDDVQSIENKRLKTQLDLLRNFDMPIINQIFAGKYNASVLDIGCNEGDHSMDRLEGKDIAVYIGVDKSERAVTAARQKYGEDMFYLCDIESDSVSRDLYSILGKHRLAQVDVIIVSMILLHLSDPQTLLGNLYPFLKPGGTIYVKDIDDRDNSATPDPEKLFVESYNIINKPHYQAKRHTGREIPGWLRTSGFTNIACVRNGLSSVGMKVEERQALFDTYYGFFTSYCLNALPAFNPGTQTHEQLLRDLGWCTYFLPMIRDLMLEKNHNFTLGFQTYLATRN